MTDRTQLITKLHGLGFNDAKAVVDTSDKSIADIWFIVSKFEELKELGAIKSTGYLRWRIEEGMADDLNWPGLEQPKPIRPLNEMGSELLTEMRREEKRFRNEVKSFGELHSQHSREFEGWTVKEQDRFAEKVLTEFMFKRFLKCRDSVLALEFIYSAMEEKAVEA